MKGFTLNDHNLTHIAVRNIRRLFQIMGNRPVSCFMRLCGLVP